MKENSRKVGEPLTGETVKKWVNEDRLKLDEVDHYSDSTIYRWLHHLGFQIENVKNCIYVDGHERADVIAYRSDICSDRLSWCGGSLPILFFFAVS